MIRFNLRIRCDEQLIRLQPAAEKLEHPVHKRPLTKARKVVGADRCDGTFMQPEKHAEEAEEGCCCS